MGKVNFSFIIPHKNSICLLNRCLETIPERDDIEIIVVDDNSDKNINWNALSAHSKLTLIRTCEGKGAGYARNIGLKHAHGKWILFPDADDFYSPNFIRALDKYKDSYNDVIYFGFNILDGNTLKNSSRYIINKYIENYDIKDSETLENIRFRINPMWCKMVSMNFIKKFDLSFEEQPVGNDMFFNFCTGYLAKNLEVEKNPLYNYIVHDRGTTKSNWTYDKAKIEIRNQVKKNGFYRFIGHPEWIHSWSYSLASYIKRRDFKKFFFSIFILILNCGEHTIYKNYYSNILRQIKLNNAK